MDPNQTIYLNVRAIGATNSTSSNEAGTFTVKMGFHADSDGTVRKVGSPICDDILAFADDVTWNVTTTITSPNTYICVTGDVTDDVDWKVQYQVVSVDADDF